MMFPQSRKSYRFRFSRVMALIILLNSSTQASSGPKSCVELLEALFPTSQYSSEFLIKFIECLSGIPKQINSWKTTPGFLGSIPIKKPDLSALSSGEGLLHLSAYLLYESFKLYDRAMNLDIDYTMYGEEFKALQMELNSVKEFIEKELTPMSIKQGNIANLQKSIEKLLGVLSRYSAVLRELMQAIHRDTKKTASDRRWSAAYAAGATGLCAGAIFTGNLAVLVTGGTCVASAGAIALNLKSYSSLSDTLEKLGLLWEDTKEMRDEIAKYRRYLAEMSI